jgi:hypothetical protein
MSFPVGQTTMILVIIFLRYHRMLVKAVVDVVDVGPIIGHLYGNLVQDPWWVLFKTSYCSEINFHHFA